MTKADSSEQPAPKKAWNRPEIRDQSIRSLTEGKNAIHPSEVSTVAPS